MRARLRLRHAVARLGADPAWAHRIRADADGREPRPRALVSPPVSCRRLAALRPRQPQPFGVARLLPRSHLRPRRNAGGLGGPGGAAARTQGPSLKSPRPGARAGETVN